MCGPEKLRIRTLLAQFKTLHEKCPKYVSFCWSVFSHTRTEYGDLLRKSSFSARVRENTDQRKLRIWTLCPQWKQNKLLRQIHINLRNRYKNCNTDHGDIVLNLHGLPSYCFIKLSRLENYLPFLFFSLLPFWTLTKDDSK